MSVKIFRLLNQICNHFRSARQSRDQPEELPRIRELEEQVNSAFIRIFRLIKRSSIELILHQTSLWAFSWQYFSKFCQNNFTTTVEKNKQQQTGITFWKELSIFSFLTIEHRSSLQTSTLPHFFKFVNANSKFWDLKCLFYINCPI